jgi:hypothetical protein
MTVGWFPRAQLRTLEGAVPRVSVARSKTTC